MLKLLQTTRHRRSTLSEICKVLGISKSSAYTVLKTLQDASFVSFDEATKEYSLGLGLLELGGAVADRLDDVAVARPYLSELTDETQETCIIARWMEEYFIVLHCQTPSREVRVSLTVGQRLKHVSGALGKAYLAYSANEQLRSVLSTVSLRPYTPNSITEVAEFEQQLEKCRQLGYAVGLEEAVVGINAVASPIFDKSGSVTLVLGIFGFSSSLSPELMERNGARVRETAGKISAALGHPSSASPTSNIDLAYSQRRHNGPHSGGPA
jgi:DNA-binding IclR family transcriptional regulator